VKVIQNGKEVKFTKKEATLMQLINKAASGDAKAAKSIIPLFISSDEKAERKLNLLDVKSPRFNTCMSWVMGIFDEAIRETPGVDDETLKHIFGLAARKMVDFEKTADRILNSPKWTPETSPDNPFLNYRKVKGE
jgi:hypothetical protein